VKRLLCHEGVRGRFDTEASAHKYAKAQAGTATDRRERRRITQALASVPEGALVLDLPCGAGRLLPFLVDSGYRVVAADVSAHMVEQARKYVAAHALPLTPGDFHVTDVLETGFADDCFDAVVCNRLFHHFSDPAVRRQALRELGRICTGPIVVSFFRDVAYDALTHYLKHRLFRQHAVDRIPISLRTFREDIVAAGLDLQAAMGTRPLISKQWYVLLGRAAPSSPWRRPGETPSAIGEEPAQAGGPA